jgi:predicted Rossmann fold flavoprotein
MTHARVVVMGGGAAGFFAAITCAEAGGGPVLILEKAPDVLAKVRVSGGGRCNVTHACFDPARLVSYYPRGGPALRGAFTRFQPTDTAAWFAARGVPFVTEEDGCMFPATQNSQTIIDALTAAAKAAGVSVWTEAEAVSLEKGFRISLRDGRVLEPKKLLLATGSGRQGYAWAESLGHRIVPLAPSLFTFRVPNDPRLAGLAGFSVPNGRISLAGTRLSQEGPLLVTHEGFSGPAALKLSAWGAREFFRMGYKAKLIVSWVGDVSFNQVMPVLRKLKESEPKKSASSTPAFGLSRRFWERLAGNKRWGDVSVRELHRLAEELTAGVYAMDGQAAFKEEFVTSGGVDLDQVDFKTMESRLCPGLHFAGEVLDVDGVTGGFNFQNAWTTGWLAGRAMAAPSLSGPSYAGR